MFYRIYTPERLADVLRNMVIPKMYRKYLLANGEEDAVYLANSISDAALLSPDVWTQSFVSRYWNGVKSIVNTCCRIYPDRYTKVLRIPKFQAIKIKDEWLDVELLRHRETMRVESGEWLYPKEIILPEQPEIIEVVDAVEPYYEMLEVKDGWKYECTAADK